MLLQKVVILVKNLCSILELDLISLRIKKNSVMLSTLECFNEISRLHIVFERKFTLLQYTQNMYVDNDYGNIC